MQEYYSVQEVAQKLKVKDVTVQRMLRNGGLKGIKINKRMWRISATELNRIQEEVIENAT